LEVHASPGIVEGKGGGLWNSKNFRPTIVGYAFAKKIKTRGDHDENLSRVAEISLDAPNQKKRMAIGKGDQTCDKRKVQKKGGVGSTKSKKGPLPPAALSAARNKKKKQEASNLGGQGKKRRFPEKEIKKPPKKNPNCCPGQTQT